MITDVLTLNRLEFLTFANQRTQRHALALASALRSVGLTLAAVAPNYDHPKCRDVLLSRAYDCMRDATATWFRAAPKRRAWPQADRLISQMRWTLERSNHILKHLRRPSEINLLIRAFDGVPGFTIPHDIPPAWLLTWRGTPNNWKRRPPQFCLRLEKMFAAVELRSLS